MVHFYESSIVITKDNLYCKIFANEHPEGYLIAKPKYIPSNKISSTELPLRFLFGETFHRLDMWKNKEELTLEEFGGVQKGSEVFIKQDLVSLMRLSKK